MPMAHAPASGKAWLRLAGAAGTAEADGELRAYSSANEALAAAAAAGGGTVQLGEGVYDEGTLKVTAGVSLIGAGADKTVVQSVSGSAILCAAGAVRLAHLEARQTSASPAAPAYAVEVRGAGSGVGAAGASNVVQLDRCRLVAASAAKLSAALLVHAGRAAASHCDLHAPSAHGVVLAAAARLSFTLGEVADCGGAGVLALPGADFTADGLEIRACAEGALLAGKGSSASLTGCLLFRCGAASQPAVTLKSGASARLRQCELDSPPGIGVQLDQAASAALALCSFTSAGKAAVAARAPAALTMEDCNVTGAGGAGVMLVDCGPEVAILRCTVTGAAKAAVQISAPAQNKTRAAGQNKPEARAADAGVPQNRRAGNSPSQNIPPQNGSSTTGPDKNSCSAENSPTENGPLENSPTKNGPLDKISVENGPLDKIPVENGPLDKISVEKGPLDKILVEKGPLDKISVENGALGPLVAHCTLAESGGAGVYVFEGAAPVLRGNVIRGSAGAGVRVEGSGPWLEGNVISEGGAEGVSVSGRAPGQPAAPLEGGRGAGGRGGEAGWGSGIDVAGLQGDGRPVGEDTAGEGEEEEGLLVEEVAMGPSEKPGRAATGGGGAHADIDALIAAACNVQKNLHRLPTAAAAAAAGSGPFLDGVEHMLSLWRGAAWEVGEEDAAAAAAAVQRERDAALRGEACRGARLIGNTISANARAGVCVSDGAAALVEDNTLSDGRGPGILFCGGARGVARRNRLSAHTGAQLEISGGGTAPLLEANECSSSPLAGGALCHDWAGGILRGNLFSGQGRASIRVSTNARTAVVSNLVTGGAEAGIVLSSGACPVVARNDVSGTGKAGVLAFGPGTCPLLVGNRVHNCGQSGVYFYAGAGGVLRRNDVFANTGPGVLITENSDPELTENLIREGDDAGVLVHEGGRGRLRSNNIHSNRTYGLAALGGGAPAATGNWLHGLRQGGVLVDQGGGGVYECNDVEGNAKAGVTLRAGCAPVFRRNRIRNGNDTGVHAMMGGGGLLEDNDIFGNAQAGVAIETGANPKLLRNRIHDGLQSGVFCYDQGLGLLQENDVYNNLTAGVQIVEGADPILEGNTLREQRRENIKEGHKKASPVDAPCVWVHSSGKGRLSCNEIRSSWWHGVVVGQDATPLLQENSVHDHKKAGVFVQDGGAPTLLENDISRCNVGIECIDDAVPVVRSNNIHHHKLGAVWVYKTAGGTFEDNELHENGKAAVRVWNGGDPLMQRNRIWGGRSVGLLVYEFGRGQYLDNEIYAHASWNVEVKRSGVPVIQRNKIHSSLHGGVLCHGGGGTHIESEEVRFQLLDNEIYSNSGVGVSIGADAAPLIQNNAIHSGHSAGVYVSGTAAKGTLRGNDIYSNEDGVVVREGGAPTVEGNKIRDQTRRGVLVCARGQGSFTHNHISNSGWSNVEVRGDTRAAAGPEIEASELNQKKKAYASLGMLVPLSTDGVVIAGVLTDESGATSVTLRLNTITGGGGGQGPAAGGESGPHRGSALLLADNAKGFVKENTISGAAGDGIRVTGGADPEIVANTVEGCGGSGLVVDEGGKGRVQNNTLARNAGAGMRVSTGGAPDARGNRLEANQGAGLLVEHKGRGRWSANTVGGNAGHGVELRGGATAVLRANHVSGNGGAGFLIAGSETVEVVLVENEVHSNGAEGVLVSGGADPLLQKNGIRDNAAAGVRITSGGRGRLLRNRIERNGARGLWADEGCAPVRGLNYVQANAGDDGTEGSADAEGGELERERAELERAEEVGVEGL